MERDGVALERNVIMTVAIESAIADGKVLPRGRVALFLGGD
jgi:hypothetical protein